MIPPELQRSIIGAKVPRLGNVVEYQGVKFLMLKCWSCEEEFLSMSELHTHHIDTHGSCVINGSFVRKSHIGVKNE